MKKLLFLSMLSLSLFSFAAKKSTHALVCVKNTTRHGEDVLVHLNVNSHKGNQSHIIKSEEKHYFYVPSQQKLELKTSPIDSNAQRSRNGSVTILPKMTLFTVQQDKKLENAHLYLCTVTPENNRVTCTQSTIILHPNPNDETMQEIADKSDYPFHS